MLLQKTPKIFHISKCIHPKTSQHIQAVQPRILLLLRQQPFSSSDDRQKTSAEDLKIDLDAINKRVEEELEKGKEGRSTELDKKFMNFSNSSRINPPKDPFRLVFTWKYAGIFCSIVGSVVVTFYVLWRMKRAEQERNRKHAIGRVRIGGEWELINADDGKLEGTKDLLGKWLLIYFGFTNCPDICPEEIEKLLEVVEILNREDPSIPILPIFISVDPERDTIERVRKYCSEFSPKLRGYTGNKEQVNKVTKAFRIYHSQGPRTSAQDDYIVDHTVIMYLVDPEGQFHDYYGQKRRADEIANVIRSKALIWQMQKERENSWLNTFRRKKDEALAKEGGKVEPIQQAASS